MASLKKLAKKAKDYPYLLIIMRHAKAEPALDNKDSERELTDKGRKQAKKVAKGLINLKMVPDAIVCSGAIRARQSAEKLLDAFGDGPAIEYRQALYESGPKAMWEELKNADPAVHRLMLICHEPSVSMMTGKLAKKDSDSADLTVLSVGISSATVAILGSSQPFSQWEAHSADLLAVLSPKEISE